MRAVMKSILLVDDDVEYLRQFKNFLVVEGLMVQCAANGEEALSLMQDSSIHLMITDLNMPGMDGIELARKALELIPHLPIILSTGSILENIPQVAEDAGVRMILYKPFDPQRMMDMVNECVAKVAFD
jgi:two-component system chemotaxis response regulator CheY